MHHLLTGTRQMNPYAVAAAELPAGHFQLAGGNRHQFAQGVGGFTGRKNHGDRGGGRHQAPAALIQGLLNQHLAAQAEGGQAFGPADRGAEHSHRAWGLAPPPARGPPSPVRRTAPVPGTAPPLRRWGAGAAIPARPFARQRHTPPRALTAQVGPRRSPGRRQRAQCGLWPARCDPGGVAPAWQSGSGTCSRPARWWPPRASPASHAIQQPAGRAPGAPAWRTRQHLRGKKTFKDFQK